VFNKNSDKNSSERRVGLLIQYDGTNYSGWQKQKNKIRTIQETIENEIKKLDNNANINLVGAGRTDAGVHASGQVAHFDCSGFLPDGKWAPALNGRLPNSIRILESVSRPSSWHACYSAILRRYRYTIYNGIKPNIFLDPWVWHKYKCRLNEKIIKSAIQDLRGFHDFAAFCKAGSKRKHTWTTIHDIQIERKGDLLFFEIQASGFIYGMVRLLVGQLVLVGEEKLSPEKFRERWVNKLRDDIKESAPANGLCLIRIGYIEPVFSIIQDTFPKYILNFKNS
tara:strand:- start:181 stop:1023 length:843 start_codon:yes stop_codon:yes gene_type:complete